MRLEVDFDADSRRCLRQGATSLGSKHARGRVKSVLEAFKRLQDDAGNVWLDGDADWLTYMIEATGSWWLPLVARFYLESKWGHRDGGIGSERLERRGTCLVDGKQGRDDRVAQKHVTLCDDNASDHMSRWQKLELQQLIVAPSANDIGSVESGSAQITT
ncbi:hypothetical protein FHL15_003871 [Xylaria flabelliformis]|uniref:Uncharacterized protein n=1 Tax=Xylaria flabelliformis TaxID=2512241 RepID=A0A553I4P5_9PEZI|nr:hypothetical protein FHL15_003871 [Xylaria flabelliformis]